MSKVPALLKWIGNKQRFAETIISYMPEQFNNYYEPFLGSGAVMAQLLYQNSTTSTPRFTHSYASDILPFLIDIFNIDDLTVLIEYIIINSKHKKLISMFTLSNCLIVKQKIFSYLKFDRKTELWSMFEKCILTLASLTSEFSLLYLELQDSLLKINID